MTLLQVRSKIIMVWFQITFFFLSSPRLSLPNLLSFPAVQLSVPCSSKSPSDPSSPTPRNPSLPSPSPPADGDGLIGPGHPPRLASPLPLPAPPAHLMFLSRIVLRDLDSIDSPAASMASSKKLVTRDEWERKLRDVKIRKEDMNRLVMNFLVTEGFVDAADKFRVESGTQRI